MNRREFLGLSAAAAAALASGAFAAPGKGPARAGSSQARKKGLGRTIKQPGWARNLTALRCKWFYSWNSAIPEGVPPGVDFVPMIFRHRDKPEAIAAAGAAARAAGIDELLGFNEPDASTQGDMSVAQALDAWPLLMDTGLRLGSPSCVHPDKDWMTEFMAGVEKRRLRVDFVCVHSYGGPNPEAFLKRLDSVHRLFRRPLWITEFAVGDWKAKSAEENQHRPETVLRFMEKVLPALKRLDYVERYAWFPAQPSSAPLGTSALYDSSGALTPLGECYRDA